MPEAMANNLLLVRMIPEFCVLLLTYFKEGQSSLEIYILQSSLLYCLFASLLFFGLF
jgi:hypothetical protein